MISSIKEFLIGFTHRGGILVALSSLLLKFCSLLISIFIVRYISKEDLGNITFAMSMISIFSVFSGLGSNWSLLRFGPLQDSYLAKYKLFRFSIKKGLLYTIIPFLIIVCLSFFLPDNVKDTQVYLIILGLGLFSTFIYESLLSYFRILNLNKIYSKVNSLGSIITVVVTLVFVFLLEDIGYVLAIVSAPAISFILFRKHIYFLQNSHEQLSNSKFQISENEFFRYGLFTGLGMIANQMVISSGGMLAGYYGATSDDIALFRVATIIPFNLMFIPLIIMTSDFVHFSKNYKDKTLLWKYYLNYFKSIMMICGLPFLILIVFNEKIINFLFGEKYIESSQMSLVLIIGILFSFCFRIPLGNILSAVGKANWNVLHSIIWLILFVPLSYYLYCTFGIIGIAYSIALVLIISGFISLYLFNLYLRRI